MSKLTELSKEVSYALRHAPCEYELEMDEEGWVPVGQLLDAETAFHVGLRHDMKPCILKIDAVQALKDGIKFYYGNEKVWLADEIPSKYITEM